MWIIITVIITILLMFVYSFLRVSSLESRREEEMERRDNKNN